MKEVLADIHKSTGGPNWVIIHNWLSSDSFDSWFGLTINESGDIQEIDLRENNLTGIVNFDTSLCFLIVYIVGQLPQSLAKLDKLEVLDLHANSIGGKCKLLCKVFFEANL